MNSWGRKLRGLLGLTAFGGAIGALYGMARMGLMALMGVEALTFEMLLQTAAAYGGFASIASAGVGVLLATTGSRLRLQELSPWKAGMLGVLLGAGAPLLFILATWSGGTGAPALLSIALRFGLLGGVVGGGLVAVAKRADASLPGSSEGPVLIGKD